MKRLFLVFVLIAFVAVGTAFADFGIGVHGGGGMSGGGGGVNFAFTNVFIYIDYMSGGYTFGFSGAVDFIQFVNAPIIPNLNWYIRLGIGAAFWDIYRWNASNDFGLAASVRAPIGLSWKPIPLLEVFVQVYPQIGLQILPGFNLWSSFFGGNLGVRLWF